MLGVENAAELSAKTNMEPSIGAIRLGAIAISPEDQKYIKNGLNHPTKLRRIPHFYQNKLTSPASLNIMQQTPGLQLSYNPQACCIPNLVKLDDDYFALLDPKTGRITELWAAQQVRLWLCMDHDIRRGTRMAVTPGGYKNTARIIGLGDGVNTYRLARETGEAGHWSVEGPEITPNVVSTVTTIEKDAEQLGILTNGVHNDKQLEWLLNLKSGLPKTRPNRAERTDPYAPHARTRTHHPHSHHHVA